jgi:dTDP-4-dehydrorhamnose 3,5-epimerase
VIEVEDLSLAGAKLIRTRRFGDVRGWFSETFSERWLSHIGISGRFVQDNMSWSESVGTLRGLHAQRAPMAQAKLVSVVTGAIFDVIVDGRKGSPTFGRHHAIELSADTPAMLYVPVGFFHGFVTTRPATMVCYKVDNFYSLEHEVGIRWDDPALGIDWPLSGRPPIISDKDRALPLMADMAPL